MCFIIRLKLCKYNNFSIDKPFLFHQHKNILMNFFLYLLLKDHYLDQGNITSLFLKILRFPNMLPIFEC